MLRRSVPLAVMLMLAACGDDTRNRGGGRGGVGNNPPPSPITDSGLPPMNGTDASTPVNGDAGGMNNGPDATVNMNDAGTTTPDTGIEPPPNECTAGTIECTDSFAYHACGRETPASGMTFGPRIPCYEGNSCANGMCSGSCVSPEIMLVVDRSSSMQGARWDMVRASIEDFVSEHQNDARFGLRMFPSGGGCSVGGITPPSPNAAATISAGLTAPSTDSQTPLSLALADLASSYGDPNEGQYAILITDGDETCSGDPPELRAEALLRSGVRTFVIGVSTMANAALLHRIAGSGGTFSASIVSDRPGLDGALEGFLATMNICSTAPSSVGGPCGVDADCGSGGMCMTTLPPPIPLPWPDGYCTQTCSLPAQPCPGGAACVSLPGGTGSLCAKTCTTDMDCRPSYRCFTLGSDSICTPF